MSGLDLGALGLVPEEAAPATPATPAAPAAAAEPATPAEPEAPTPEPVEADEEIVVPEGAENPDAVKNLIQAERAAARAAYKRARDAEAKLAAIEEANTPVEDRLVNTTTKLSEVTLENLKLRAGIKHGLSETLSNMLQGTDEASIDASAQALIAELGTRSGASPVIPGATATGSNLTALPVSSDPHKAHAQFLGQLLGRRGA